MSHETHEVTQVPETAGGMAQQMSFGQRFTLISRLSVKMRIALLGAVPLLALLIGSLTILSEKNTLLDEMADIRVLSLVAQDSGGLVHELQKERGASAGFLGSKGTKFGAELGAQRNQTDNKLQVFTETVETSDLGAISAVLADKARQAQTLLSGLSDMRRRVSDQQVAVKEALGFYTSAISGLLDVVAGMSAVSSNAAVNNRVVAYYNFSQMKERNGIERAVGSNGFATGAFEGSLYRRLVSLIAEQKAFLTTFDRWATEDQRAFYGRTVAGEAVNEVERMRAIALNSTETGNTGGVDATYWFATITKKINMLKKVEDRLAADVIATADQVSGELRTTFFTVLTVVCVLLVVMGVAVFFTVRGITRPLMLISGTMSQLAQGNKAIEVPETHRRDEIGEMARTVQVFKENAVKMDQMAAEQEEQERRAEEEKRQAMMKMADDLETSVKGVVESVSSTSTEVQSSAESMSTTAEEASRQSAAVSAASEQASTNVQTAASAAEELSTSIEEIGRQVADSAKIAEKAVAEAESADGSVQGLAEAA
ncbi:MAG: nitrate- and nitrite sensing domain-containing protein, partial [Alphaproteobacteria bacterium]